MPVVGPALEDDSIAPQAAERTGYQDILPASAHREPARVRRLLGSQLQNSALPERLKVWEALRLFSVIRPGGPPWERLLDEWGRVAWDLVAAVRDRGTTVLLVTHFMDEAQRLCDRLAVLRAGRVVANGTVAQLVSGERDGSTVRFTAPIGAELEFLHRVPGVTNVAAEAGGTVRIAGAGPLLARVGHALVDRGIEPLDLGSTCRRSRTPTSP